MQQAEDQTGECYLLFQGVISAHIPILSSVCLRSPVEIPINDWTVIYAVNISGLGMGILETAPKEF